LQASPRQNGDDGGDWQSERQREKSGNWKAPTPPGPVDQDVLGFQVVRRYSKSRQWIDHDNSLPSLGAPRNALPRSSLPTRRRFAASSWSLNQPLFFGATFPTHKISTRRSRVTRPVPSDRAATRYSAGTVSWSQYWFQTFIVGFKIFDAADDHVARTRER